MSQEKLTIELMENTGDSPPASPIPPPRMAILCPYCGHIQVGADQCDKCRGQFEPLSRQATQNAMGPWQIRNERLPFVPGMSYEKIRELAQKGRINRTTIIRGPSTRQFWSFACNTPGVATLIGECHNCHSKVLPDDYSCKTCGAVLTLTPNRQHLGLAPFKLLPGEADPHEVASSGMSRTSARPAQPAITPAITAPAPSSFAHAETDGVDVRLSSRVFRQRKERRRQHQQLTIAAVAGFLILAFIVFIAANTRTGPAVKGSTGAASPAPASPPAQSAEGTSENPASEESTVKTGSPGS